MASNKTMVPEAREGLNRFKMEAANEVGVNLKQGYNGDLTSKQAGSIGGQMVKKMIQQLSLIHIYQREIRNKTRCKIYRLYHSADFTEPHLLCSG